MAPWRRQSRSAHAISSGPLSHRRCSPRAEFSEVFEPLFSHPSSNKPLKLEVSVEVSGFEPPASAVRRQRSTGLSYTPETGG